MLDRIKGWLVARIINLTFADEKQLKRIAADNEKRKRRE
jgi:hypothetical protein